MTSETAVLSAIIRRRRTNMRVDPDRSIDPAVLTELCELATWAPNHKLTEPWRFAVVTGEARARLGEVTAQYQAARGETNEAKLDKMRGKYLRTPVILIVGSESTSDDRRAEDRDAVSAGVQNLLLAATAHGLCSYWGTGPICHAPAVRELCGFAPETDVIGAIYLGWSIGDVPAPARQAPTISWVTS